jgi:hypothetical protein
MELIGKFNTLAGKTTLQSQKKQNSILILPLWLVNLR